MFPIYSSKSYNLSDLVSALNEWTISSLSPPGMESIMSWIGDVLFIVHFFFVSVTFPPLLLIFVILFHLPNSIFSISYQYNIFGLFCLHLGNGGNAIRWRRRGTKEGGYSGVG
jgi:hypothetical protein